MAPGSGYPGRVPGDTENTAAIFGGDTIFTRDLGMGMPKTRGYPNHCDTTILNKSLSSLEILVT